MQQCTKLESVAYETYKCCMPEHANNIKVDCFEKIGECKRNIFFRILFTTGF